MDGLTIPYHGGKDRTMPQAAPSICTKPGCNALVYRGSRCDAHKTRERHTKRVSAAKRGYGRDWGAYARGYRNENKYCVDCLKENKYVGSEEVDHIIPPDGPDDPLFWDPENHQALCKSCHSRKTAREDGGFRGKNGVRVIVCGPPGSGKTTYVKDHRREGDLILDLDALVAALSMLPQHHKPKALVQYGIAARDAVLELLSQQPGQGAWIITGTSSYSTITDLCNRFGAKSVILKTDPSECKKRIDRQQRIECGIEWHRLVDEWYEQHDKDIILTGKGGGVVLFGPNG